jgi:hypothetical protein
VSTAPTEGQKIVEALLGELGPKAKGWRGLLFEVSTLKDPEKRKEVARTVMEAIDRLSGQSNGTVRLANQNVLRLVRDATGVASAQLVALVAGDLRKRGIEPPACKNFDLQTSLLEFSIAVSGVDAGFDLRPKTPQQPLAKLEFGEEAPLISPKDIARVEQIFFKADVSNFIRNQTAYWLVGGNQFSPYFDELYISVDELSRHLKNACPVTADRWLFQHLTRTLDVRLLTALGVAHDGERKGMRYSINLNVSSLMGKDFTQYDATLPLRVRQGQTIEIQAFDLLENAKDLPFLKAILAGRGYRICADAVDHHLFTRVDWAALGVDSIKIRWTPNLSKSDVERVGQRIDELGQAERRVEMILCRCDDEAAIDWGAELGIRIFQGWFIDKLKRDKLLADKSRYSFKRVEATL